MPYNARPVREYAGGSIGGILRKGGSSNNASSSSSSMTSMHGAGTATYSGEAKQIDLLVFGYACKVFRDDDKARDIDQGKHLIPWMGDSSLKIDRYDVRGALFDLAPHEAPPGGYGNRLDYLSADEQRAEQLCEEERYFYLYHNEEQHNLHQEEELKRFKQESGACYNQVGLQYGNDASVQIGPAREENSNSPTCGEEADQVFVLPANFVVPPSIQLPETMKQHAIIEKTARFIASQGVQMEILLKAKQSNNLQFEFLTQNSLLNPYYKFVVNAIKEGTYPAAIETPKEGPTEEPMPVSEQSSYEQAVAARPIITVPTIKYKPSANCAYTQLISKIKGVPLPDVIDECSRTSVTEINASSGNANEENFTPVLLQYNGNTYVTAVDAENSKTKDTTTKTVATAVTNSPPKVEILKNSSALLLAQNYSSGSESEEEQVKPPPPPPKLNFAIPTDSLQNIIDKTASYVIKNGRQFEETLRSKSEERFTFLLPDNEFYPYYMYKITGDPDAASIEKKTRRAAAVAAALLSKKNLGPNTNSAAAHVSFSIKSKEEQPISSLQPALPQENSDEDDDDPSNRPPNSVDNTVQPHRNVPEHVKRAIQLVESQLMARNAQLAAAAGVVLPPVCTAAGVRSRFDVDFNGQLTTNSGSSNAEIERNAIFEQQQQNRHKELKRAEEKVKDKLAQIAREKLGGLISKGKQLQLERKRKAMAFLNQIKGSSENEATPDKKPVETNGNVSDNSDTSVQSIPITSYGPDGKSDEEDDVVQVPQVTSLPTKHVTPLTDVAKQSPDTRPEENITIAVTLSDDDDVQLISETKAPPRIVHRKRTTAEYRRQRRSRSRSRTRESNSAHVHKKSRSRHSSVASSCDESPAVRKSKSHSSHKAAKKSSSSSKSSRHSKKKTKKSSRTRSRSRSQPRSKSHRRSRSHSAYRIMSRSDSQESLASHDDIESQRLQQQRHHSKRSKRSRTPTRKEKRRKHER